MNFRNRDADRYYIDIRFLIITTAVGDYSDTCIGLTGRAGAILFLAVVMYMCGCQVS